MATLIGEARSGSRIVTPQLPGAPWVTGAHARPRLMAGTAKVPSPPMAGMPR